jgi:MarR family transcriptional regulator, organic hydroperoxide resistance regulator
VTDFMGAFARASKVMRAVNESALRRHGLHLGQHHVLAMLAETDGQTPGAIAVALNVTTPTVVKMATRMAAAGVLTRRRDDPDNRLVRLYLTAAGRDLVGPVAADQRRIESQVLAGLTRAERKALVTALDKVAANATALLGGPVAD